jgi:hypothetical protein
MKGKPNAADALFRDVEGDTSEIQMQAVGRPMPAKKAKEEAHKI